jgi:hypothetical protein
LRASDQSRTCLNRKNPAGSVSAAEYQRVGDLDAIGSDERPHECQCRFFAWKPIVEVSRFRVDQVVSHRHLLRWV